MERTAAFSSCRRYRYALRRRWAEGPEVLFVMLNPSAADETRDDPTVRRCIGFARRWGFGGLAVGNLFAFRTHAPALLKAAEDPVGDANDGWLLRLRGECELAVAAWGNHGRFGNRAAAVGRLLAPLHALGFTRLQEPRHPLYAPADAWPARWLERDAPPAESGAG